MIHLTKTIKGIDWNIRSTYRCIIKSCLPSDTSDVIKICFIYAYIYICIMHMYIIYIY